jgi:GNAT superfamily N-acetyltransferase
MNLGKFDCSTGIINILYTKDDLIVRTSVEADLIFIDKIQKENSYAIGFIPQTYFEKAVYGGIKNSPVFICEKNNDPVGYIYMTPGKGTHTYCRIQQIAVREDARRLDYGSALIAVVKDFCETFQRTGARLRCRTDLESNNFWKALGFSQYGLWEKGLVNHSGFKASADINLWQISLNDNLLALFDFDEEDMWTPNEQSSNLKAR